MKGEIINFEQYTFRNGSANIQFKRARTVKGAGPRAGRAAEARRRPAALISQVTAHKNIFTFGIVQLTYIIVPHALSPLSRLTASV